MPDPLFADARLAAIYDDLEGERDDLDLYEGVAAQFDAHRILDLGCGTGSLACRLAEGGYDVIGVDPAAASLDVARRKPHADAVRWIYGEAADLAERGVTGVDLVVMTGNVAQVFVTDEAWGATLAAIRAALTADGAFVFETRDPEARAWETWASRPPTTIDTTAGPVRTTLDVTAVALPLVSFRWTYTFLDDGEELVSESTLRFRGRHDLTTSLAAAGFRIAAIGEAPDRPGREFVVVARVSPSDPDDGDGNQSARPVVLPT